MKYLCPHCGFNFETLKPSEKLQPCPCGKSYADITPDGPVRILFEEKSLTSGKKNNKIS